LLKSELLAAVLALSHPIIPQNSELLAAALRYRTSHHPLQQRAYLVEDDNVTSG
jgi:hypothetical protein